MTGAMVLVDTSVWSMALRARVDRGPEVKALAELVAGGQAGIIGPIRQELLSGVRHAPQFHKLRLALDAFPNEPILPDDYIAAAGLFNTCRRKGVQGSHIDFLICAVSLRLGWPILTNDRDFKNYQPILGLKLLMSASD